MGVNRMKKRFALLLLLPVLLTACAAADLDEGAFCADPSLSVGMPMADAPEAWKSEAGAPVQYAGLDFTGSLESPLYSGVYSDEVLLLLSCRSVSPATAEQVQAVREALERDYGVRLPPMIEDETIHRWFLWNETACLVLNSMGEDPDAQQAEIVVFLQDYQDYT